VIQFKQEFCTLLLLETLVSIPPNLLHSKMALLISFGYPFLVIVF